MQETPQSAYPWLLRRLVDSHLWIAFGCSLACLPAIYALHFPYGWQSFIISLTAATFSAYNFHRIRLVPKGHPERYVQHQRRFHFTLASIGAIVAIWYVLEMPLQFYVAAFPPFLLTTGYLIPVSNGRRLRDLPYIKTIFLSVTLAYVQIALPASLDTDIRIPDGWIFFFGGRCAFMFALCLPFDIRDIQKDNANHVKTYANQLGIPLAKKLCMQVLLCGFALLCISFIVELFTPMEMMAWVVLYFLNFLFIRGITEDREGYYCSGMGDGILILQGLLFVGAHALQNYLY